MISKTYREKYKKKSDRNSVFRYPAGGQDIVELCDIVDYLEFLFEDVIRNLPTDLQNEFGGRLNTFKIRIK